MTSLLYSKKEIDIQQNVFLICLKRKRRVSSLKNLRQNMEVTWCKGMISKKALWSRKKCSLCVLFLKSGCENIREVVGKEYKSIRLN